jgi:protein-disulfide isomerase
MSQLVRGAPLLALALTACSPACTPPEAKDPSSQAEKDGAKGEPETDPDDGEGDSGAAPKTKDPTPPPSGDMIMEAKGVDLSGLSESQQTTFFQIINTEPSACDKPHSMATSLRDDATCRDSLVAAQFVADRLKGGASTSQVKSELEFVVDSLKPRKIPIEGRPVYGSERAPVTVVVFADFQCPHCQKEAPILRKAIDQFRGRAKLVYKHFPLGGHPRAKYAAIAAEAALEQGKFWEMHDAVFANPEHLEDEDILKLARQIGLDMAKFEKDYESKKMLARVEADRADGEKLDIQGTPAVYVNGRFYNQLLFGGSITGWIDDALKR